MTGRETLIGAGLAAVLVIGIIDAAAGHDDSSPSASPSTPAATDSAVPSAQPTDTDVTPGPADESPLTTPSTSPRTHRGPTSADSATATPSPRKHRAGGAEASATPSSEPSAPTGVVGTFSYATTGGESTNIPGTSRQFPKTTKIKNKAEGCGISSTWRPIPEHVQKQVLCPADDGVKVKSYETTISFYGVSSGENFKCSGDSYVYREDVKAGDTWSFKCKSPDAVAVQSSRAVGFETIEVGGTAVRTLHVHVETTLKGDSSGSSVQDYWIATKTPVLVKEAGKVNATQQNVHYTSSYSLALKSLSPKT